MGHILANQISEAAFAQGHNLRVHFFGIDDVIALLVNDLALIVGHIIVFKQLFARVKVARFHFALRTFNAASDHAGFNGFAFWHFEPIHDGAYAVACKNAHEGIV